MLERNEFLRCILVDFSQAFDTVNHSLLKQESCAIAKRPINGCSENFRDFLSLTMPTATFRKIFHGPLL